MQRYCGQKSVDKGFFKPCLQGYKDIDPVQIQTFQSLTTVPPSNTCTHAPSQLRQSPFAGDSLKQMPSSRARSRQHSQRRSKRQLAFTTSPRPRGNETSSPGKAPKPFPWRCCAIEETVWLSMDNILTGIYYARATRAACLTTSSHIAQWPGMEAESRSWLATSTLISTYLSQLSFFSSSEFTNQVCKRYWERRSPNTNTRKEISFIYTQTPISPWQPFQSCVFRGSPFYLAFDCSIRN